jgi:hypothetical protein
MVLYMVIGAGAGAGTGSSFLGFSSWTLGSSRTGSGFGSSLAITTGFSSKYGSGSGSGSGAAAANSVLRRTSIVTGVVPEAFIASRAAAALERSTIRVPEAGIRPVTVTITSFPFAVLVTFSWVPIDKLG